MKTVSPPRMPLPSKRPTALTPRAIAGVLLGCVLSFCTAWLTSGFIVMERLIWTSPLTEADLHVASWLGSPSTALAFGTALSVAIAGVGAVMGILLSIAKQSPFPFLGGMALVAFSLVASNQKAVTSIGLLEGTVKLGCYVEDTRECRQMLHLPWAENLPSMYEESEAHLRYSAAYLKKLRSVAPEALVQRSTFVSIPGGALLRAPLYWDALPHLEAKVVAQRQALRAYQEKVAAQEAAERAASKQH